MTKDKLTVRIPPELSHTLRDMSKVTGLTKNGLITQAILDYVRKYEQKEKSA